MAKYLVETYYTCNFKVKHYLDELNEDLLSKLDQREDGKFEIIDVKLDTRKTKNLSSENKVNIGTLSNSKSLEIPNTVQKDLSKKLSEKKRTLLSEEIKEKAISWSVGRANPQEIDTLNILHATMLAMQRAVQGLNVIPDYVLVDGNRCPRFTHEQGSIDCQAVVKGDDRVAEISAASIIAKVARDEEMHALDKIYPEYGFAKHKGYPTKLHLEKIIELGVLDCYRQSFKPVARVLAQGMKNG